MPWRGDPTFGSVIAEARGVSADPRIPTVFNRSLFRQKEFGDEQNFITERLGIYAKRAVGDSGPVGGSLGDRADSARDDGSASRQGALAACRRPFLDLWALGRHRLLDVAPLKPLAEQSPVLAALAREPRGTRVAGDRFKNLPMLIGQSPISAYRTLDLPVVPELTSLANGPLGAPVTSPLVRRALRATGSGFCGFSTRSKIGRTTCWDGRASLAKRSRTPHLPVGFTANRG